MNRLLKKWLLHFGGFIILNMLFLIFDGTSFIKSFNFGDFGYKVYHSAFFVKWLHVYSYPLFNLVAAFAVLQIIGTIFYDIYKFKRRGATTD